MPTGSTTTTATSTRPSLCRLWRHSGGRCSNRNARVQDATSDESENQGVSVSKNDNTSSSAWPLLRWLVRLKRRPSALLLLVQLLALLAYPFVSESRAGQVISTAISVGVLSAAVWMVHRSPRPGWIAGVLALCGVGAWTMHNAGGSELFGVIGAVGYAAAYFYAAVSLITYMMSDEQATRDELWAAGATFMLFTEAYAWLFVLCQLLQQDAFLAPGGADRPLVWIELIFLSATNFSATGLSDIIPLSPHARTIAIIEQWNGVMYMALIVSRLAGMLGRKRGSD
ncbi:MAG: two pore domain potassium channel family protein [Lysobacteraceae bacterium]|nr:MAG: two pore domain potassium channel family protein [Xanthomonadaceae bacterium]